MSKSWALTQPAFEKLLASLDPDRERAGERYEMLRRKLVKFFEWRCCASAEDHADETLNRVARRLDRGESIHDLFSYVAGVARMVVLEVQKQQQRERATHEDEEWAAEGESEDSTESNQRMECLELCMQALPSENQRLIAEYYREEKRAKIDHRKALAQGLGVPLNSLRIRVCRIRAKLEQCVSECLEQG